MAYPKGFILITSIVLMFVCSSIIFAYFMRISHEYQRVEINIAQSKAKYNALSGFALEAYENMFFRDFITDTLANGEPADSVQFYVGGGIEGTGTIEGMGNYDSVSVRIRKTDGQLVRYGYALGTATYNNTFGKTLTLTDSVDITTKYLPKLNTFMYLTGDELAGGAPQIMNDGDRGTVRFRDDDEFDGGENGDFQTNGTLVANGPPNCPEFQSTVTLTRNSEGEINEPDLNGCNFSNVFKGEPPTDTSGTVCLPPPSFDQKKKFADFTFDATELLVSDGNSYPGGFQRDTLIMTELEFLSSGGFRVSRYKYLMPPHLKIDLPSADLADIMGNDLETDGFLFACGVGVEIDICNQYEEALNRYHAKTRAVLNNNNDLYIDPDVREAHGVHHFDTHLFRYDPGLFGGSEFEPKYDSNRSTEYKETVFHYPSEPVAIYVKGGPVLVHGTFKGRYTVITDEYMTYRRHAYPINNANETPIDTIYCNIWLVDDLVNADAEWSGTKAYLTSEYLPDKKCKGGSENGIGLVSGANVIIANTRANGARSGSTSGGLHINIHAHMIAFNESFTIQYWQNSTSEYWNDWNNNNPIGGDPTYLADGNGNRYGALTGEDDDRGHVYLLGGFVQLYRGYMFRNQTGPYDIWPGIGMDKWYTWDDNMRCNALPLYPEKIECDNDSGPPQYDFEIAQFRIF